MKQLLFSLSFVMLLVAACSEEPEKEQESGEQGLTFDHFQYSLKADMDYNDIIDEFGEPTKDIGSGIHIYVYALDDLTEIWIGFTDRILYARHHDQNQLILHTLIET